MNDFFFQVSLAAPSKFFCVSDDPAVPSTSSSETLLPIVYIIRASSQQGKDSDGYNFLCTYVFVYDLYSVPYGILILSCATLSNRRVKDFSPLWLVLALPHVILEVGLMDASQSLDVWLNLLRVAAQVRPFSHLSHNSVFRWLHMACTSLE